MNPIKKGTLILVYENEDNPTLCEYLAPHYYQFGVRHDLKIVESGVHWQAVNLDAYDWTLVA